MYIEGSRDPSPAGKQRLAGALAQRYGLSAQVVSDRLARGRFCAWASVDLATARRLAAEVEALGATASVADAAGPGPAAARETNHGLPPPPATASQPPGQYTSGLAAAFAGEPASEEVTFDLGALHGEGNTGASWQLARLDGSGEELTTESPAVIAAALAADRALAGGGSGGAPPAPPAPDPFAPPGGDPFAPPDAGREAELELDAAPQASGTVAAPSAIGSGTIAAVPATSTFRGGAPASGSATLHRDSAWVRAREALSASPRLRLAAGVAAAFLLGLVPAQIFAAVRAAGAYDDLRRDLQAEYERAESQEDWSALEGARQDALALAATRQQRIAVSSCLVWILVAGAVAFAWFRLIDWEGFVPRLAPAQLPGEAAASSRRRVMR